MNRRTAGDLALTEVGIGAAQFGNLYRETTDEASTAAVDAAWVAGVRYFDTAPHYGLGLSERRLGDALQGKPRDEFVISTKVGRLLVPNPGGEGAFDGDFLVPATTRREWDLSRDGIRRSLHDSLERLGLDRVDVLYLHDPDEHEQQALSEALPAMIELRDEGVVKAVGAGMNQSAMLARFAERLDIDIVMLAGRYTLLEQGALDDLLPAAQANGVSVVAAAIYNSGLLATARIRPDAHYNYGAVPRELLERTGRIAELCDDFGITIPDAAVAFPLRHPAVASVVIGTRTERHVSEAAARHRTEVPEEFWSTLVQHGLLDERAEVAHHG
ncbi:aldo/keto reductase [Microbacterium sp. Sa4CUA7]|uniref:Aldo/keto reductase n=1 Tax=Microbacterium pullorum TaxID=2762236 RepID=A0ABR8S2K9_9MICO|nr:aldo/keto reductase [Microbacterium pullorum]MBD7957726.1 aldo/keto reductase [Microbacterium pullorum]